jgi:ketosteroid isomerase-like protein
MATTLEVGNKLVGLCRQAKFNDAMNSLYADNIVSVEAMSGPNMQARTEGIAAVRKKAEWWEQNHEVHNAEVHGPWPHGDRFIVRFILDVTPKAGPMAGKKMHMDEAALYTVKDGKIVQEEFFYHMGA